MKAYIANFGRGNYEWPRCLEDGTVATMIHEESRPFFTARNREGFIDWCIANRRTARGITPTRSVASRWYGAMEIVETTEDDVWIHKADDDIWWTTSTSVEGRWHLEPSKNPQQAGFDVYICHKPCEAWSNRNRQGAPLKWHALHAKAKPFLFTEGTLQQLSDDNAAYALALIAGDDLTPWHSRPAWKAKAERAGRSSVTYFDARKKTIWTIINTVKQTVRNANGQTVERSIKNKELRVTLYRSCI